MISEGSAQGYDVEALRRARRVHIATVRRDGNQSKAVPVWFTLADNNSILVQTGRGSWTARRVRAGSPVIVWIGGRNGYALMGVAEISSDAKIAQRIVEDYPRKYLAARMGFHRPTQERFERGEVVAIRITPTRGLPSGFASRPGSRAPGLGEAPDAPAYAPERSIPRTQVANLLSASRFVLAALWLAAFMSGMRMAAILGSIAIAAAVSDFADGWIARRMGQAEGAGRWLDPAADIVFVLTALTSEALAGAIPVYIPVLIGCSFAQYAIDSAVIGDAAEPIKSRLGHWGGIINFALVLVLAWAPPPLWPGRAVRRLAPLIAGFYAAAMLERAISYRLAQGMRRGKVDKRDGVGPCKT